MHSSENVQLAQGHINDGQTEPIGPSKKITKLFTFNFSFVVVEEYLYGAIKTEVSICAWVTLKQMCF